MTNNCGAPQPKSVVLLAPSFYFWGVYPDLGRCISSFTVSIYDVYAWYRREKRHGKVLLGVLGFWRVGNPLFPRRYCPCGLDAAFCDEESGKCER